MSTRIPALLAALAAAVLLAPSPALAVGDGTLNIDISGLHSTKGQLIVCLWKDKPGFPTCQKRRTAQRKLVPDTAPALEVSFPGLAPGAYAVTVQHDENGDGKMQSNFIGMPKEGVGVSNNPGGMPGYAKSLFNLAGNGTIAIRMKYLFGG